MSEAIMIKFQDMMALRDDLEAMDGALAAVEAAVTAQYKDELRQHNIVDRRPGEFEGIRLALLAGDGLYSGLRIFGNPPHTRAFMLFDGETRAMVALMDYGVLNSMRVGSIAGVAGKHLHPKGTKTVGLIGSGWQAQPQVAALVRGTPSIEKIKVFSPTQANRERFAAQMTPWLGIEVEPVGTVQEAVDDADIVDLCAPGHFDNREPLYDPEWIKPGALIIAMANRQSPVEAARNSRIVASRWDHPGTGLARIEPYSNLVESGELTSDKVTELGAVIVDGANPRKSDGDNILFHLEGGTGHDLFIATWGYEWARAKGYGTPFNLAEGMQE